MPGFEQWTPLLRPAAATLSLDSARFLFTYDVERDGHRLTQTTAISCELTLVDVVKSVPDASRRAICRIVKERAGVGRYWQAQDIDVLWLPAKSEQGSAGGILFQLRGESCVRNVQMHEVAPAEGRVVLFKRPSA